MEQRVTPAEPVVSTTFRGWMAGRGSGGVLAHVGRQRDAGGLEDAADLAGDRGAGGDALAILLDGSLLEAIEMAHPGRVRSAAA